MKSYIVIGLGRFGTSVATKLQELGNEVLVVDENQEHIQRMADVVTYAVVGDARDERVLRSLDVGSFDCAVVAIGGNLAASILITLNLKALGVPNVICKAPNEQQKRALEKVGADRVVIPEHEMAVKLAQNLVSTSVLDYTELSKDCGIAEIRVPKAWIGKTLRELDVRVKFGVTVAAPRSAAGDITVFIGPDYKLDATDELIVVGRNDDLVRVQAL